MTRLFYSNKSLSYVCDACGSAYDSLEELSDHIPNCKDINLEEQTTSPYSQKAAKLRPTLFPTEALLEGIKAFEFGTTKYAVDDWKVADLRPRDILNALERHLIAYKLGEKLASDSQVSHLGHIIANCAILLARFDKKAEDK